MDNILVSRLACVLLNELYQEWIQTKEDAEDCFKVIKDVIHISKGQFVGKLERCIQYDNWLGADICSQLHTVYTLIDRVPTNIKERINRRRANWYTHYSTNINCPIWFITYLMRISSQASTFYNVREVIFSVSKYGCIQMDNLKINLASTSFIHPFCQETHQDGTPITEADVQRQIDLNRAFITEQLRSEYRAKINEPPFQIAVEYLLKPTKNVMDLIASVL